MLNRFSTFWKPSTAPAGVITLDARSAAYVSATNQDPHTFDHVINASANFLVVLTSWESSRTITNVRCGGSGGTLMTKDVNSAVVHASGINLSEIWYLANPPSGTQQIWIDLNLSGVMVAQAVSFFGVDTSSPIADSNGHSVATTNSITMDAPLVPDGTCWLEAVGNDSNGTVTHTWGGGATETFDEDMGASYGTGGFAADVVANITPSFSLASGNGNLTLSAVLLRAA